MCNLPASANIADTRGPLERVSYANVMAKINEKMSVGEQIKFLTSEFGYSISGASLYLKRNGIKNSGSRGSRLSVYSVEPLVSTDMKLSEKVRIVEEAFGVTPACAYNFFRKHPACGTKKVAPVEEELVEPTQVEEIEEAKTLAKPEETNSSSDNLFDDIQKTMLEIKQMEAALSEKKQWLRMLMEEYIS